MDFQHACCPQGCGFNSYKPLVCKVLKNNCILSRHRARTLPERVKDVQGTPSCASPLFLLAAKSPLTLSILFHTGEGRARRCRQELQRTSTTQSARRARRPCFGPRSIRFSRAHTRQRERAENRRPCRGRHRCRCEGIPCVSRKGPPESGTPPLGLTTGV